MMNVKENSMDAALDSLATLANRIADERNEFKRERDAAISALRALYDAIPTGFGEDRALNEATKQAEKVLGMERRNL